MKTSETLPKTPHYLLKQQVDVYILHTMILKQAEQRHDPSSNQTTPQCQTYL